MTLRWALWALAGALSSMAVISGFSIGLFIAPVAALAVLAAVRWGDHERVGSGLIAGLGITLVVIGVINLGDYHPCKAGATLTLGPGETSKECGGLNPVPWLIAGGAAFGTGLALGLVRRSERETT
jgi:hypothetical protein